MKIDLNPLVGKVVRFKKDIEDCEGYAEAGMVARFASFSVDSEGDDESYRIVFDFSEFADRNKPFETAGYFDSNGRPVLTAREAGFYEDQETYYIGYRQIGDCFELIDPRIDELYKDFNQSRKDGQSYVEWLENQLLSSK